MNIIDISNWKPFVLGDLFDIAPTVSYKLTNNKLYDGGVHPVVVNSKYNNGIGGYTSKETTENAGIITFSDTVDANTIFYQPVDFVGYSHVQKLVPIGEYAECWEQYSLMFFATVFKKVALTKGFDFGVKFRRDIAIMFDIPLPVLDDGSPDWHFMKEYMHNKMNEANAIIKENI